MRTINMEELQQIAQRAAEEPFFVSDVQGALQVWREFALTHVRRNENDEIVLWSLPASYRDMDKVVAIDLESWDPGEDATDDQRRQDISDLVNARAAVPALLAEIRRLKARVADLERPAVEEKRSEIVLSYRQLAAQARDDGDYEGEATVLQRLAEREQQWAREDDPE